MRCTISANPPEGESGDKWVHSTTHVESVHNGVKWVPNVVSNPPAGKHKVTNIYWDPVIGKVAVEFDDAPQP